MRITQEFSVSRPLPVVWAFFKDIPRVACCLPGAEYLGPKGDGKHSGKVSAKIGPFQASFEGEADVVYDEANKSVRVDGKGVDRKGASRGKMTMACGLVEEAGVTKVAVEADVQLSGSIAQFGRTGLLNEIANTMVADFVRNAEAQMTSSSAPDGSVDLAGEQASAQVANTLSVFALLAAAFKGWLRSIFSSRH